MLLQGSVGIWCLTHRAQLGLGGLWGFSGLGEIFGLLAAPKVELQGGNTRVLNWRCEQGSPGKGAAGAWGMQGRNVGTSLNRRLFHRYGL